MMKQPTQARSPLLRWLALLAGLAVLVALACQAAAPATPTPTEPPLAVAPSETLPPPPTDTAVPPTDTAVPPTATDTAIPPSETPTRIPHTPTPELPFVIVRIFVSQGDLVTQLAAEAAKAEALGLKPFLELEAQW